MPGTMQSPPQQWNPVMRPEGMVSPPPEERPWWMGLVDAGQRTAQGLRAVQQMTPKDVLTPDVLQADDAQRQLRMERARQAYERRFGSSSPAGASMASQGQQSDVESLLRRIQLARQMHNWRPGGA